MPNVNRQTIYQMGNVVNDVVKQATGRDPVKQINMDFVTVEQNTLMGIETQSGAVVTFNTPKSVPLLTLEAQIVAQQDLHGYDYPWPAGGGKNKFSSTMLIEAGKNLTDNGTMTTTINYSVYKMILPVGNYIWSGYSDAESATQTFRAITYTESDTMIELFKSVWEMGNAYQAFTVTEETSYVLLSIRNSYTNVQVEAGSEVTAYAPYSNICPITGFTGCNISVSGGDNPERIYPVEWESVAGTVYGGVLDAKNGKLTVTHKGIDLGSINWSAPSNGGSQVAAWIRSSGESGVLTDIVDCVNNETAPIISNTFKPANANSIYIGNNFCIGVDVNKRIVVYNTLVVGMTSDEVKEYLTGVQLVYELKEPVEYDVVEVDINTLACENVMSANTGNISLSYYVYHDLL